MAQGGDGCAPRTIGDRIDPHVDLVARITGFFARIREGHDGSAAATNVPACAVPFNTANPAFRSARLDDEVETAAVAVADRMSTRLHSSHYCAARMQSSACQNNELSYPDDEHSQISY